MPEAVLFEGESDRLAFEAAARARGMTVDAERIVLGGITNLRSARASAAAGQVDQRWPPTSSTSAKAVGVRETAES